MPLALLPCRGVSRRIDKRAVRSDRLIGLLEFYVTHMSLSDRPRCKIQEAQLLLCSSRWSETCGTEENGHQQSFAVRGLTLPSCKLSCRHHRMQIWGLGWKDSGESIPGICMVGSRRNVLFPIPVHRMLLRIGVTIVSLYHRYHSSICWSGERRSRPLYIVAVQV